MCLLPPSPPNNNNNMPPAAKKNYPSRARRQPPSFPRLFLPVDTDLPYISASWDVVPRKLRYVRRVLAAVRNSSLARKRTLPMAN